jgi:hypothetical protein
MYVHICIRTILILAARVGFFGALQKELFFFLEGDRT